MLTLYLRTVVDGLMNLVCYVPPGFGALCPPELGVLHHPRNRCTQSTRTCLIVVTCPSSCAWPVALLVFCLVLVWLLVIISEYLYLQQQLHRETVTNESGITCESSIVSGQTSSQEFHLLLVLHQGPCHHFLHYINKYYTVAIQIIPNQ